MATLEQVAQALLDAQQTMLAMRQQFDAELRGMRDHKDGGATNRGKIDRYEGAWQTRAVRWPDRLAILEYRVSCLLWRLQP